MCVLCVCVCVVVFFLQAEDGIRDLVRSRGLGDVYKRQGKEWEYVDPAGFPDGADTVFLLSDGDPTDDDWAVEDKRDKDDQTGDPAVSYTHLTLPTSDLV